MRQAWLGSVRRQLETGEGLVTYVIVYRGTIEDTETVEGLRK